MISNVKQTEKTQFANKWNISKSHRTNIVLFLIIFSRSLHWFTILGPAILDNSTTAPCFKALAVSRCSKATCFFLKENGRTIFPQLHVKIADIFSVAVASSFQTASIYHSFIFICTIFLVIFAILCGSLQKNLLLSTVGSKPPNSRHDTFRGCPPPFVLDGWFRAAWLLGPLFAVHLRPPLLLWNHTKGDSNPSKTCGTDDL